MIAGFVSPDESLSIMINEEDHIRIQSLHAGLNLKQAWDEANNIDDKLEENMKYAYSSSLGYLTSCPSNVGTGLGPQLCYIYLDLCYLKKWNQ